MKNRKEGIIGDLLPDHSEAFDYIRELHEYLWRVVKVAVPGASGNLKDYLPAAIVILEGRRASCLLCGEPKPLIIDRRGQSVCEDCYVRGINTRAGAEPATSVRLSRGSDQVGRTGDSISPTGAALSSTERPPTENRASLIEKLRATGAKRNRLLMRQAANHIERLERIIKSAPVFDASHNSG